MLKETVCRKCYRARHGSFNYFESNWGDGYVICDGDLESTKVVGFYLSGPSKLHHYSNDPPDFCPYVLEQLVCPKKTKEDWK